MNKVDHCIVLITHNREDFVRRFLKFYGDVNSNINIVVAFSGSDKSEKAVRGIVEQHKTLNINMISYKETISFFDKVQSTLSKIKYDYLALVADDDYIIPHAVEEGAAFLKANKDYISVTGYTYTAGHRDGLIILPYKQILFTEAKTSERLKKHLANYVPTFYNIYRRRDLRKIFEAAGNVACTYYLKDYGMIEIFLSACAILKGKVKVIDSLYMIRQSFNPISNSSKKACVIRDSIGNGHINELIEDFAFHLKMQSKSKEISLGLIKEALRYYIFKYYLLTIIKHWYKNLTRHLSPINMLKYFLDKRKLTIPNFYKASLLKEFQDSADFKKIIKLIEKHPLGI